MLETVNHDRGPIPLRERRQHPRFSVPPMYSPIAVRTLDSDEFRFEGHAYDVSEGGLQFELDRPFEPGTRLAFRIELPGPMGFGRSPHVGPGRDLGPGRAIFAFATVVWIDDDEFGPARMAAVFNMFCRAGDKDRLKQALAQTMARAA
ncbi:MAG: PilZ domain-containing protein [Phycisphaera sp.]|nr:MAG: PilZ domain-containing protein [Phycisphaera sp.]